MTIETPAVALPGAAPVVAPVVAAPAPAPVAIVDPAPAAPVAAPVIPTLETPAAPEAITYDPTGDPALDVALDFIGRFGIAEDHPGMVAAQKGDFSILEAILAANPLAKGYEKHIQLGKDALARASTAATEVATQVQAAVYEVAGGAEKWATVQTWATANADPSEKAALNAMFAAGPVQARAAALLITQAYNGAAGTVIEPASAATLASSRAADNSAGQTLTAKTYAAEVRTLRAQLGSAFETSPEYAALGARYLNARKS